MLTTKSFECHLASCQSYTEEPCNRNIVVALDEKNFDTMLATCLRLELGSFSQGDRVNVFNCFHTPYLSTESPLEREAKSSALADRFIQKLRTEIVQGESSSTFFHATSTIIKNASPTQAIIDHVRAVKPTLLIVGHDMHVGLLKRALESTAESCSRNVPCSVLVVQV